MFNMINYDLLNMYLLLFTMVPKFASLNKHCLVIIINDDEIKSL